MTTQTEGQVPEEEQIEGQEPETNEDTQNEGTPENETFSREYVQSLREEAATYRTRAKNADTYREALWAERVKADGRLVDADDLPMGDADPLDADAVSAAVSELIERKPHLKRREAAGVVGQGLTDPQDDSAVSLTSWLRGNAG